MIEEDEYVERYIILLLGVKDECIPSNTHLQKELYILTKIDPSLEKIFDYDNYNFGIYSKIVAEKIDEPFYFDEAYEYNSKKQICLTTSGKQHYSKIIMEKGALEKTSFEHILGAMKLIRITYDKFSVSELELIMYISYPDTAKNSTIINKISKNKIGILDGLLRKGYITQNRYEEMLKYDL